MSRINSSQPFPNHTAQELFHYLMKNQSDHDCKLRLLVDIEKWPAAENLLRESLELAKSARIDAQNPRGDDGLLMNVAHPTAEERHIEWIITNLRRSIQCARVISKGYSDDSSRTPEVEKAADATNNEYEAFLMWKRKKTLQEERELAKMVKHEVKLGR